MKKFTKIAACSLLAALGVTAMASCGEGNSLAKDVLSKVILTQEGAKVSADFTVPKIVNHEGSTYDVSWVSSDTSVLDIVENDTKTFTADVKRPFGDDESANVEVKLTASVTVSGKTVKNDFKTTVTAIKADTAINTAISSVGIKASYGAKEELNLPAKSNEYKDEITFEYSLGGEYASAKLEGTKLTFDPELGQEAIIVNVKATCGSKVVEKEVNTKTSMKTVYLTAAEALAQPIDAMIYFQGKIKSVAANGETYGNFWIEDEAGNEIEIYGLYKGSIDTCYDAENVWQKKGIRYDAWDDFEKLAVGDYVYAYGKRAAYKDTQEISNCLLMGTVKGYPVSTVKEGLDTPVGDFVTVLGEVKSIASDKYGNMYLKDGDNEIYLYGCYTGKVSACYDENNAWIKTDNPAVRYDAMKDKPQVGDVVVIYGPRTEYNGTQQITNALLLYYVSKTERKTDTPETPETPVTPTPSFTPTATAKSTSTETTNLDKVDNPVTILGLDDKIFTVTFNECGSYKNTPGLNKDGTTRLYNNSDGEGNTLTFTVAEGYKIEKISITIAAGDKGGVIQVSAGETVITATDGVYTINGNSVTLKNIATGSSKQAWIDHIDFVVSSAE